MATSKKGPKPGDPGTPGWTGRMDQLHSSAKDMGRSWSGYFTGMVEGGMKRREALAILAVQVLSMMIAGVLSNQAKGPEGDG